MKKLLILVLLASAVAIPALVFGGRDASAQQAFSPPTNLRAFALGGNVTRFEWDRGAGNAFFCVDTAFTLDDLVNFRGSWSNWGCGTTGTVLDIFGLQCSTFHHWRVWARGSTSSAHSASSTVMTGSCGFTPPSQLSTSTIAGNATRFAWARGVDNIFFCVDTAFTQGDLLTFTGSWANWGCGNSGTILDVFALRCGTQHFWRVWAQGTGASGHSAVASFTTPGCGFTPPTNPLSAPLSPTSQRVTWTRGADNQFFCVDTALSREDLRDFEDTWRNWFCGTTATTVDLFGLQCATQYFWRVWAAGSATSGHSAAATFTTGACAFSPPTNLRAEAVSGLTYRFRWDRGEDNLWFCLDKAETQAHLLNFTGTWMNHSCGNTTTSLDVLLQCGKTYFWRVYAQGTTVAGYSAVAQLTTPACP
jgi:hypothetical protein